MVAELWRFDRDTPVIERLGIDGKYKDVEVSLWLPVRVEHLRQWIIDRRQLQLALWSETNACLGQENV